MYTDRAQHHRMQRVEKREELGGKSGWSSTATGLWTSSPFPRRVRSISCSCFLKVSYASITKNTTTIHSTTMSDRKRVGQRQSALGQECSARRSASYPETCQRVHPIKQMPRVGSPRTRATHDMTHEATQTNTEKKNEETNKKNSLPQTNRITSPLGRSLSFP